MRGLDLKEKNVSAAVYQLLLPFPIQPESEQNIISLFKENGFHAFQLQDLQDAALFDGPYRVSQHSKTGFSPLTNKIVFPSNDDEKGFHKYTKPLNLKGSIIKRKIKIPFRIHSIAIILCPFNIGMLIIRTELIIPENLPLSVAIEFGSCFQAFSTPCDLPKQLKMECEGTLFDDLDSFLFHFLFPEGLKKFINQMPENEQDTHERIALGLEGMYVQSFLKFQKGETIEIADVFRTGNLCGLTENGEPYITANNIEYIERKMKDHCYGRFAPNTFYYLDEDCFTCLTTEDGKVFDQLLIRFFSEQYLLLIISLFHRLVLLKCLEDYSKIKIKQNSKQIRKLLYALNSFTSNYFYPFLPANSINKELFELFKKAFSINVLYNDSKEIIFSLFKDEENTVTRKDSFLLLVLTLYTVVCGIFSMNLFTDDLKGKIKWQHLFHYNFFEYFAVCIVFSGMIVTIVLGIQHFVQSLKDRKNKKKWLQQTILSSKKQ